MIPLVLLILLVASSIAAALKGFIWFIQAMRDRKITAFEILDFIEYNASLILNFIWMYVILYIWFGGSITAVLAPLALQFGEYTIDTSALVIALLTISLLILVLSRGRLVIIGTILLLSAISVPFSSLLSLPLLTTFILLLVLFGSLLFAFEGKYLLSAAVSLIGIVYAYFSGIIDLETLLFVTKIFALAILLPQIFVILYSYSRQ